jgi:DNA repair protein SbcC/Rad50
MRPLLLEFQAFGSYPGKEVVDFEVLAERGLFVVTGPTGTGKTTVFDAMVYALFGTLPGGRSSDDPRSHFAAAGVDTYVQLDFEVDGSRYRVRRTPRQERPKQRGEGVTVQNPTASVVKVVGDATEAVETQATKCTRKCEELVGLDARQFQRVVLLPQGKFTDFLIATDENREQLLRQLFGGELFEQATRWLKDRMSELDAQVAGVDTEVQHHRTNAVQSLAAAQVAWTDDPTPVEALAELDDALLRAEMALLAPVRDTAFAALQAVQAEAAATAAAQVRAEADAKQFDDAVAASVALEQLEAERAEVDADRARVAASKAARPVVDLGAKVASADRTATAAQAAVDDVITRVAEGFTRLGRPVPEPTAVAVGEAVRAIADEYQQQRSQWYDAQQARTEAAALTDRLAAAVAEHSAFVTEVAALREALDALRLDIESLEPVAELLPSAKAALEVAGEQRRQHVALQQARLDLVAATETEAERKADYESVMARFVLTQAPRLAATLVDDQPCPVCGSCEHPQPASLDGADSVDHEEVDRARARWGKAAAASASAATTVDTLVESLGELADASSHDMEVMVAAAQAAVDTAAAAATELASRKADRQQRTATLESSDARERELATAVTEASTRADTAAALAQQREAEVAHIDSDHLELGTWISDQLVTAVTPLPGLAEQATIAATQLGAAQEALADALATSGHESVEAAAAVLLAPDAEAATAARIEQWDTSFTATTQRLAVLHEQGVPPARPDEVAARDVATAAAATATEAARRFTTADNALAAAERELDTSIAAAADSAELRQRRDTARIVFKTCNGEAGMRVKLERWVLAGELDRVTAAANHHLGVMTNHRYRLARNDTKGGLTLEVFDSHTGRSRATTSLSGGEQFQASLSLALGLADVVSQGGTGSGKQFEALFVDEGFGSLDPDALDDAIEALGTLRATGRMVGAITHVEAMKQALHPGIVVSRLPDGKGSTLKVNP